MSLLSFRKVARLAVLLWALAAFAPAFAQQTGGLTGKVTDDKGNLLAGYPIQIDRQDVKGHYETKTNKKGEYIYIGLPSGEYKVTLQNPSGKTVFFMNTRVGIGPPTELHFGRAKERAAQQEAEKKNLEANPELARQKVEQEKDTKQFTGLKQFFDQGQLLFNEKKYAEAAAMFEQAVPLAKGTNLPIVLARTAESYQKARNGPKAIEYFQKAIEIAPMEAAYHNNLGNVYAESGKTAEASAEFKKAAEMDPTRAAQYYFNYGAVMYNTGKMDDAAAAFKKATEVDPNFADAFYWVGLALMGKATMTPEGKVIAPEGTKEALQSYLKIAPTGPNAPNAQAMLQTMEGTIDTSYQKRKKK